MFRPRHHVNRFIDIIRIAEVCEEQVANRFRFNGQQYDPVSRQYYLRARFYNPVIARFTQEDTYRGDGLNLYAYCRNNPVYYVDPSGHFCEGAADRISGLIDEGRIKGKNRSKLEDYLRKQQESGQITPWEKRVAEKLGIDTKGDNKTLASTQWSGDKEIYSVAYEAKLPDHMYPGMSDAKHF